MTRKEQEPVEIAEKNGSTTLQHPAFAQISASRCQGGGFSLYGSDFQHDATIEIRICHSELHRDLRRDWHFQEKEIVSVRLSEAQWATFVSSMNVGSGIPCTLDHIQGERIPGLTYRMERDVVQKELQEKLEAVSQHLRDGMAAVKENLVGLSKVKQAAVLEHMNQAYRAVSDSLPFAAKCFQEHMEDTVEKAKIEIEAHVLNRIQSAGLKVLTGETPLVANLG